MHKPIASNQNSYIKWIRGLQTKKGRTKEKKFIIEGEKLLEEALQSTASIDAVLVEESVMQRYKTLLREVEGKCIPIVSVTYSVMKSITETQTPQGIAGVVSFVNKAENFDMITLMDKSFLIGLDRIQDPGNLGTIIRTADAAGANGVLLSEGTVDMYNSKVIRSTMGSFFHIPILQNCDLMRYLRLAKENNYMIIASHLKGEDHLHTFDFTNRSVILIIGNEGQGIRDEIADMADLLYKIPMIGKAESLNASIAAGIMIYDIMRKRITI